MLTKIIFSSLFLFLIPTQTICMEQPANGRIRSVKPIIEPASLKAQALAYALRNEKDLLPWCFPELLRLMPMICSAHRELNCQGSISDSVDLFTHLIRGQTSYGEETIHPIQIPMYPPYLQQIMTDMVNDAIERLTNHFKESKHYHVNLEAALNEHIVLETLPLLVDDTNEQQLIKDFLLFYARMRKKNDSAEFLLTRGSNPDAVFPDKYSE